MDWLKRKLLHPSRSAVTYTEARNGMQEELRTFRKRVAETRRAAREGLSEEVLAMLRQELEDAGCGTR